MPPHFQRALILIEQSRYAQAEEELRQTLAGDPDDAFAHAYLALCLMKREAFPEATQEAQSAIGLAPDLAFAHYMLANVLEERNRYDEAVPAIAEAIRLDPEDADYRALLAGIRYNQRKWHDALAAADEGLALNPEHVGCTNIRAMALVKLGRRAEAGATIDAALAKDPENAVTHANQGWTLLQAGDPKKAMLHFREALRLNPELDWARAGIVEALKARFWPYRILLFFFFWMARFSSRTQWLIIIGGFIGYRVVRSLQRNNPELAPYLAPLTILYIAFALATWLGTPLFNLLLRLHPFGKLALSAEQIRASNWVGGMILTALVALGAWAVTGDDVAMFAALVFGLLALPTAGTFNCDAGWPRRLMAMYTCFLGLIGVASLTLLFLVRVMPDDKAALPMATIGFLGLGLFLLGAILSEWAAIGLSMVTVKR